MFDKQLTILLLILTLNLSACCLPTSLHWAAMDGDPARAQAALEDGAIVDKRECDGLTALWMAASTGNDDIVKILLDAGADVNAASTAHRRITPLIIATAKGHTSTVKILLKANAFVDIQSTSGETALMEAAIEGYVDITQLLLTAGANVNIKNLQHKTALQLAAEHNNITIAKLIKRKKVRSRFK